MGDPIRLGQLNNAGGSNTTVQTSSLGPAYLVKQNGGGTAIRGESAGHAAILETQGPNKYALLARNASDGRGSGAAITAQGGHGVGLEARSYDKHGIIASSIRGVGIHGGGAERGVSGFSDSRDGIGVYGYSVRGNGVVGGTDSRYDGYAGLFGGPISVSGFCQFAEMASPSVPPADHARLFLRDNGSGKSQLCVQFGTGDVQVIATQP